jgi:predicted amidohydrolase YtcJ
MKRREVIIAGMCAGGAGLAAAFSPRRLWAAGETLDTAYLNASIWTGVPGAPQAAALGIRGNRIAAVGAEAVRAAIGPATRTVDLEGAFVMPGVIDNHTHFLRASHGLSQADLRLASSREEVVRMITESASRLPEGAWLEGGNWDEQRWGGELPTHEWIDAATPNTPVAVVRTDLHTMLLNSLAMKLAGIDRDTEAPPGGVILKDAAGEPTGIVKDAAMDLVERAIPAPTEADIDAAIRRGIEHGLSLGVTQVHVKELDWVTQHALRRLRARGETDMRFYSFVPLPDWERMNQLVREEGRGDDWVRWGGLKGVVDGSLGSRTALFHEPYTDDPSTRGITMVDLDELREWISAADGEGLQLAVHAIGDKANDLLLDMFAAAVERNGPRDRRFLVEHAQHVRPDQIPRFTKLSVIPSVQPFHAIDDGRWAVKRIGPERLHGTYAFKSFLDSGARLSFGSDWPVAPLDPRTGIAAAVLRQTVDGANPGGWIPEEKIPVEAALHAYTTTNAYAGFQEDRLGRIAPGMLADFVVLAENLLTVDPARITDVQVLRTVVDGRARYDVLG